METSEKNKKLACIGSYEIFKSLGVDVYMPKNAEEAAEILKRIRNNYNLILIAERFAEKMGAELNELRDEKVPLIIEMPDEEGSTGAGKRKIAEMISKASGMEIKAVE